MKKTTTIELNAIFGDSRVFVLNRPLKAKVIRIARWNHLRWTMDCDEFHIYAAANDGFKVMVAFNEDFEATYEGLVETKEPLDPVARETADALKLLVKEVD